MTEKKIFEPCELTLQSFADIITTSNATGLNGEYDRAVRRYFPFSIY